jgi:cobalt-zinc-cadmium resistance protein CzcA
MLEKIIDFSVRNKLIVILFTLSVVISGLLVIFRIPVGAVPDITNNQVQVITTSGNLSTQEIEQFITAPVEMEMANLPGVKEIRSISKFGISVVTVVFSERLGTYMPRQLIAEKIKSASANIPEGYGTPEMGPITTGLGEIYQYIVDIKPGFENQYTPMDLRTIQDWVIKRRLSGIDGVVEINSWGGHLKQYEIAIDPMRLKSLDISITEIFEALEKNNNISGGAYIEKTSQSYFIRGDGQVKSLEDIEQIVVGYNSSKPVFVKDIGKVHFGFANRFGAITANGKGETVLGQIMMLKNADSKKVIKEVKIRVAEIQQNLPDGIFINPILERSELISKTSFTVVENLILGAIIVMLTVLLLLGNLRSALVIASMIPLALLFTITMMYLFGIDANLMSLGALDFGIIIDGAVIIVEFIAIKMMVQKDSIYSSTGNERQSLMDRISIDGASKMMKSAIYGQLIILIVFIPILSLSGVEGKMFRPMALSFSFAILGAMIMGLTWLPVASSLFLKPKRENRKNISTWIMDKAYLSYYPVIKWSCNHKRIVLGMAIISLVVTFFIFSKMGGEFVPTLDEGDYVIQPILKTGTSLTKTIELTTQMENILIRDFPDEVHQIVCRIGAAEVPTDPMSMEEIDMIIKLKPREEWVAVKTKEELADNFKDALSIIPGIEYEFTQPIEMRFNELITGVRSDIAIKIFGENLEYINNKAVEVKKLIEDIPGAGDVIVEKTSGLPQIKVSYNRSKIAGYGVNIYDLNNYISTAFGGKIVGVVFEGEKRFDMVMRFDESSRKDIDDIRELQVQISDGIQIPLSELATIEYTEGPAKISRENTQRRVVVSVNVRNRDLQSVIEDIQVKIDDNIQLASGNYIEYGGQFENLQNATKRLMIVVPVALLLIFVFLHFAFKSLKDAIMIFTAIPLATVGGVLLLWIRGMPFSVSAGIGFIALFGIAILNGIVLIEHLKELQASGITNMRELILTGTRNRLRPVMLTAGAAAMGFLPMAISTGAGAEVQRPLATVVIGGLITSTMLTMIALPLLFEIFYNVTAIRFFPLRFIRAKSVMIGLLLILPAASIHSQNTELKLEDVIGIALKNNQTIAAYTLNIKERELFKKAAFAPDKTLFSYGYDQNNIAENGFPLNIWGVEQSFNFPSLYVAESKSRKIDVIYSKANLNLQKNILAKSVSESFFTCQQLKTKLRMYGELDSLYNKLLDNAKKRVEKGDISYLDELNIQAKKNQVSIMISSLQTELEHSFHMLKVLMNSETDFTIHERMEILLSPVPSLDSIPTFQLMKIADDYSKSLVVIEKNKLLPDFTVQYFWGTNTYPDAKYYNGFQVGIALPLFLGPERARVQASALAYKSRNLMMQSDLSVMKEQLDELIAQKDKYKALIENYHSSGNALYNEIMRTALKSFELGEINFFHFVNSFETAVNIQLEYIENLFWYNMYTTKVLYFSK